METQFFMAMIPPTVTAQEHQVTVRKGKPVFYDTPEIKNAKDKLMAHLAHHRPSEPYAVGIRLIVKWLFPKGRHKNGEYRITKPDTKTGFWKDDALVASEIVEKFWSDIPGIYIRIEELEGI